MDYQFETKARYRAKFWRAADRMLSVPRRKRRVAILDTSAALEVQHLLRLGYDPDHIHAVNQNPAQVACLTRTLRERDLPDVHTHGKPMLAAIKDIRRQYGECDAINFDGCSPIQMWWPKDTHVKDAWTFNVMRTIMIGLKQGGVYGHTYLVGRERKMSKWFQTLQIGPLTDRGREIPVNYILRLRFLTRVLMAYGQRCVFHIRDLDYDWYRSASGQTMGWVAAKMVEHDSGIGHMNMEQLREYCIRKYGRVRAHRFLGLMQPPCWTPDVTDLVQDGSFDFALVESVNQRLMLSREVARQGQRLFGITFG